MEEASEIEPPEMVGLLMDVFGEVVDALRGGWEVGDGRVAGGGDLFGYGCLGRIDRRNAVLDGSPKVREDGG